ncbi:DUF4407 domain-containing protein [Pedobacter rhizosphaerae]|uniref:DUF4407 domain-containing protein n=1 Tax=Pedobacter rhizosphaerae TaxID=390241 RepID=A0A1H9L8R2_9SPHI|nr:DUF4407 domain-containing protein [Pedobacter rhizosphaerae]SER07816.1 protein of unknown function [Pedobacter rhizosphaerae]
MKRFQFWWLKLSCFLTGYNFYILSNCSEVSSRKVKKYAAALLIVATVWAFVGYCFCSRYIKLGPTGSISGALIAIIIIIQIERQILLADKANIFLKWIRVLLAMLMAVVGSLIIDQIIFKDDIDKNKIAANQKQVNSLMPDRSKEIINQISQINASLLIKENERKILLNDINKNPTKQIIETTSNQVPITSTTIDSSKVSTTKTIMKNILSKTIKSIQNPKFEQLPLLDTQIATLNNQKINKENTLLELKTILEAEIKEKVGFLDELNVMINILKQSVAALIVYIIWFSFLLILELLILIGKVNDTDSDYDKTIQKQMSIHLRKIDLL